MLQLLPSMMSNEQIAGELFVSVNTVKVHLKSLYRKLGVSSRREAVMAGADWRPTSRPPSRRRRAVGACRAQGDVGTSGLSPSSESSGGGDFSAARARVRLSTTLGRMMRATRATMMRSRKIWTVTTARDTSPVA